MCAADLTCNDKANSANTRGRPIRHCAVLADRQLVPAGFAPDLEYASDSRDPTRDGLECIATRLPGHPCIAASWDRAQSRKVEVDARDPAKGDRDQG